MRPIDKAAMMVELRDFPRGDKRYIGARSFIWSGAAPQEQFDAFTEVVYELFSQFGTRTKSGSIRGRGKACRLIRLKQPEPFSAAMGLTVQELGHIELLLTAKILIFT